MTTTPVGTWNETSYPTQTGTQYPLQIDANMAVCQRTAATFNPEPASTPNMTVTVAPGSVLSGNTLTEVGQYTQGTVTGASNAVTITGSTGGISGTMQVTGTGIPSGTTATISGTTVTLSQNATASGTGVLLKFSQITATFTAPGSNSRIDRVVIDNLAGTVSVVTGTASATPTPPSIPSGKTPIAQVRLTSSTTAITGSNITDERNFSQLGGSTAPVTTPNGRLTLTSSTPVMSGDVTAAGAVYYAPYNGNVIPIYNGSNFVGWTFSQLTLTLNSTHQTSGNLYDVFVFLNGSTVTIGAGPAWSSSTTRGTGTGTTQLQQLNGLWVNSNAMTLYNGSSSYSASASDATYVGTVYMTANAQTAMQFKPAAASGGSGNVLGLWNAYNRVRLVSEESDSSTNWTYATNTWRASDGSTANSITYVDGLGQSFIDCRMYQAAVLVNTMGIGINRDSTSATPVYYSISQITTGSSSTAALAATESFPPAAGLHYVQAMECSIASASNTLSGSPNFVLQASLEM